MHSAKLFTRVLAAISLIFVLFIGAFADTVRLKDGSVIKGKIVKFNGGIFVMVIGQGERQREMTFFADEVESIEFDTDAGTGAAGGLPTGANRDRPPAYTESVSGNETIITVGSSRSDNPAVNRDDPSRVDPDAVAVDPAAGTSGSSTDTPVDDTPILDNDPIGGEPIGDGSGGNDDPTRPGPVQIKVSVLADDTANGWTNSGWVVKRGQKIRIISNGRISLGNGRTTGPRGLATLPDPNKLMTDKPTGALIAVIGDDNNDFIFVGENLEFTASRDGALFLGVNEANLNDNSGAFDVIIEIEPEGS